MIVLLLNLVMRTKMIKNLIQLILIFACSTTYAQGLAQIRSHNQLTGTGSTSHDGIDTFIASKGQASGLASLDANGKVIQSAGTVTGYVSQNNGTGTLSQATIAGVAAPYIAQTNGTGTGNSLTNATLTNPSVTGSITAGRIYNSSDMVLNVATGSGISLRVNNIENAFLNSIGLYVGGSGLPSYPLHVIGTSAATGNIIQTTIGSYHYFGGTEYGFRDNAGTMQFKNTGGSWVDITGTQTTLVGGWQDDGTTVRVATVTDKIAIGTTTAAANQILTVIGSQTTSDLTVLNRMGVGFVGTPTVDLAVGDDDTGLEQESNGVLIFRANGNNYIRVDANGGTPHNFTIGGSVTTNVLIGTTTSGTRLNVGGTVTAEGFSGNGYGLTNLNVGTTTPTANAVVKADSSGSITAWFPGGMPVRMSATATSSLFSLSAIPDDNTIPQSSEGVEVLTLSHTPTSASNWLLVEAISNISGNVSVGVTIAAVFKNSDTDAIGANRVIVGGNGSSNKDTVVTVAAVPFLTGTTTPFTFSLRCGGNTGTVRLNGSADDGLTRFNGKWYTWLKVTEYKP